MANVFGRHRAGLGEENIWAKPLDVPAPKHFFQTEKGQMLAIAGIGLGLWLWKRPKT